MQIWDFISGQSTIAEVKSEFQTIPESIGFIDEIDLIAPRLGKTGEQLERPGAIIGLSRAAQSELALRRDVSEFITSAPHAGSAVRLFAFSPKHNHQLSATALSLTRALMGQRSKDIIEVVHVPLYVHAEFVKEKCLFVARYLNLAARAGFSLSSEYYSAAFNASGLNCINPDDFFFSFHQIMPRRILDLAKRGKCRSVAYIDMSLSDYIESYSLDKGLPHSVIKDLVSQEKECMAVYEKIFVFDSLSKQAITEEFSLDKSKVEVVGRGANISCDNLKSVRLNRLKRRKSTPSQTVKLVFIGLDFERKGLRDIIAGIDALSGRERLNLELHVIGPDVAVVPARSYMKCYGFLDWSRDQVRLQTILTEADMGILLSKAEGLPGSLFEFLACGIPVISTALPRIKAALDGEAILFLEPEAINTVSDILAALLGDGELMKDLTRKAELRMDAFEWSFPARQILNCLATGC